MKPIPVMTLLFSLLPALLFCQNGQRQDLSDALNSFNKDEYLAHLGFLSDDLLEGRDTGTRGYDIAARYISAHLQAYGVSPGGDQDTYFQTVRFVQSKLDSVNAKLAFHFDGQTLHPVWHQDFVIRFAPNVLT